MPRVKMLASSAVLLAALLSAHVAQTRPMEILLAGEVDSLTETLDAPFENVAVGDPFGLRLVFDSDAPEFCVREPHQCDPEDGYAGSYYRADSMVVAIGDVEYSWESPVGIEVHGDWGLGWDALRIGSNDQPSEFQGRNITGGFDLIDDDGSTFDSELLPAALDLADFSRSRVFGIATGYEQEKRLLGTITSLVLRPVPEPSVAGLIVFALVGLAAARAAR